MKYYVYISDTKVDMLYDQIGLTIAGTEEDGPNLRQRLLGSFSDSDIKDLCFDLGVDYESLPGLSKRDIARELIIYMRNRQRINELIQHCRELRPGVEWTADVVGAPMETGRTPYAKLQALMAHLHQQKEIGSVDGPKGYFKGEATLRWGEFRDTGLVYFTGIVGDTLLGLGGSLRHVIGVDAIGKLDSGGSRSAGNLERTLIEELNLEPLIDRLNRPDHSQSGDLSAADDDSMIWAVQNACERITGSKDRLEFVARKLWESDLIWERDQTPEWMGCIQGRGDPAFYGKVVLGTPLYVAHAD